MTVAYIGVGSNIDPEKNITEALKLLGGYVKITGISTFFLTDPIGRPGDPEYYNGVVRIETEAGPAKLKTEIIRSIEDAIGRRRTSEKFASRPIDLDLLLYGEQVMKTRDVVIPDPEIRFRPFISIPLFELEPGLTLPDCSDTIKDIAGRIDAGSMRPLEEFTRSLKRRLGYEL